MSWLLAFAGFAALIILHEAGHFVAAKAVGMRVEKFYLFFPPKLVARRRGETEYGIGAIPLGGFVKITGMNPDEDFPEEVADRAYYAQPVWKRIVVIAAGPFVNLVIAFVILFALAFGAGEATNSVDGIQKGTPAAGLLKPGDRLLEVDGHEGDVESLRDRIASHKCAAELTDGCRAETPVSLTVERGGKRSVVTARPVYDASAERMLFGFQYGVRALDPSPSGAAKFAVERMWDVTTATVGVIAKIFKSEDRKQISSVVGSYEVTRQAIQFDARTAIGLLGIISLSLAIINLFPFLPLDGGHIFWSVVEKLRGRPVPFKVMERAGVVGFALVLMLFAVGLSNDIGRLAGEGFNLR